MLAVEAKKQAEEAGRLAGARLDTVDSYQGRLES